MAPPIERPRRARLKRHELPPARHDWRDPLRNHPLFEDVAAPLGILPAAVPRLESTPAPHRLHRLAARARFRRRCRAFSAAVLGRGHPGLPRNGADSTTSPCSECTIGRPTRRARMISYGRRSAACSARSPGVMRPSLMRTSEGISCPPVSRVRPVSDICPWTRCRVTARSVEVPPTWRLGGSSLRHHRDPGRPYPQSG